MLRFRSLVVFVMLVALPAASQEFSGTMRFSDADTLKVGQVTVRLFGIDAPESDQSCERSNGEHWACGQWATHEARTRFDGRTARCTALDRDLYGRVVARCHHDGQDMSEALVRAGIAMAFRRYSMDYIGAEKEAAIASRGIWEGTLQTPSSFRAAKQSSPAEPQGACNIKGNVSSSGRIYHLPGQKYYGETRITESRGERWFCSEQEAIFAGWRRAKQ